MVTYHNLHGLVAPPGLAEKSLPELPKFSIESPHQRVATDTEPCPSPVVRKWDGTRPPPPASRSRIPQFRQSRRWAKAYGAKSSTGAVTRPPPPPPTPPPKDVLSGDSLAPNESADRVLTKREASFERQRAELKKSIHPQTSQQLSDLPRKFSESSSGLIDEGCCRATTYHAWRTVKPAVSLMARPSSRKSARRRSTGRKTTAGRRRDSTNRRIQERSTMPLKHAASRNSIASRRIPSLHGQIKDGSLLQECLRDLGLDREWATTIDPSPSPLPVRPTMQVTQVGEKHIPTPSIVRQDSHKSASISPASVPLMAADIRASSSPTPNPAIARKPVPTQSTTQLLQPPMRTSSNYIASLASMMELAQAKGTPLKPTPSKLAPPTSLREAQSLASESDQRSQRYRLPSLDSVGVPALKPQKSILSTHTMDRIEHQVHTSLVSVIDIAPEEISLSSSGTRHSGPPGIPPELPLPALPANAGPTPESVAKSASSDSSSLDSRRTGSIRSSLDYPRHSIQGERASRVRATRMRDLANSRNHSPSSLRRGSESRKGSLASNEQAAPAESDMEVDQLDQFPTVPTSRPSSVASAATPSRNRRSSHGRETRDRRQQLRASPEGRQSKGSRQVLSQSNIFVVVDYDPLTARFRAGAVSPTLSIGGTSGGPAYSPNRKWKHARVPSSLSSVVTNAMSPVKSMQSTPGPHSPRRERALPSPTATSASGRKPKRSGGVARQHSNSSDDSRENGHAGSSHSPAKAAGRSQKRRRWNSGDINVIKLLQRDLEDYYGTILKQDEVIKWREHQMNMMTRVLAPMNRARGVKTRLYLEDTTIDSDEAPETSLPVSSRTRAGQNGRHQGIFGPPLSKIDEQPAEAGGCKRSDSTASSSSAVSKGSAKASADDASMTDPCEHEPMTLSQPSKALTPGPNEVGSAATTAKASAGEKETSASLSATAAAAAAAHLRQPPPVAQVIPRHKLKEEKSFVDILDHTQSRSSGDRGSRYYRGQEMGTNGSMALDDEADRNSDAGRLSVNHVLGNTEQMDRALDQFARFG